MTCGVWWRRMVLVAVSTCLAACGGGGGSGSGGTSTPQRELPLDLAGLDPNAVTAVGFTYASVPLIWAQFAKDGAEQLQQAGVTSITQPCAVGGQLTWRLVDRDASGSLTSGDQLQLNFAECHEHFLDEVTSGTLTVDLLSDPAAASRQWRVTVPSDFLIATSADGTRLKGGAQLAVSWSRSADVETITVTPDAGTAMTYAYTFGDGSGTATDQVRNFVWTKVTNYATGRYQLGLTQDVMSELMGGTVQLRSTHPLAGHLNHYPDVGLVEISGANGGKVSAGPDTGLAAPGDVFSVLRVSSDTSAGGAQNQQPWSDAASDYLWWGQGSQAAYAVSPAISSAAIGDVAVVPELSDLAPVAVSTQALLHVQLNQAFQPGAGLSVALVPTSSTDGDTGRTEWGAASVPADLSWNGARITITPHADLMHGWTYHLRFANQGMTSTYVFDANNNRLPVADWNVNTEDSLHARVAVVGSVLVTDTEGTILSGQASTAPQGSTYQWHQISGPAVSFGQPQALQTTVNLAAGVADAGSAVIELQLTAPDGQIERQQVTLQVVPSAAQASLIVASRNSGLEEVRFTNDFVATASFTGADPTSLLLFQTVLAPGYPSPTLDSFLMVAPGRLAVGSYSITADGTHATSTYTRTPDVSCMAKTGTFDIEELTIAPDHSVQSLAAEFDWQCGDGHTHVKGSVRIRSTLPLP